MRLAQTILNKWGENLKVDGYFGAQSRASVYRKTKRWLTSNRGIAYVIQLEADKQGIGYGSTNDAWWGSLTEAEAEQLLVTYGFIKSLPKRPDECGDTCRTRQHSNLKCWSPTTRAFTKAYGMVGMNQGMVETPYPLVLDWDTSTIIDRFSAHESVVDSIERVMERAADHYGLEQIEELGLNRYGGCLNIRKKRGGSSYSTHSWGVAIDWFPSVNRLRETHKTARFAQNQYKKWLDLWEEEGFMSLGRCYDFDWMHVQKNP